MEVRIGHVQVWWLVTCELLLAILVLAQDQDACPMSHLPDQLNKRLFPLRILNPSSVKCPNHVVGSTCFSTHQEGTLIFTGYHTCGFKFAAKNGCESIPAYSTLYNNSEIMAVQNTVIETLQRNAFSTWVDLQILQISMNRKLRIIQPGAFNNLTNLWNLTISDSPKLSHLTHDTFQGLINLREFRYLRNNVKKLSSVTVALSVLVLPNVTVMDFSGNDIRRIERDDFEPMEGSPMDTLMITLTKTEWIDSQAFDPLARLVNLVLSRNNLNCSVLTDLVDHLIKNDASFTHLVVRENLLQLDPKPLLNAVAKNGSKMLSLNIQDNHLGVLSPDFFPKMSNLEDLYLINVMIDDVPKGAISYEVMPNLKNLYMGGNIFSSIKSSMVTKTLQSLYINDNDNNLPWRAFFHIDHRVFAEMPELQLLDLSGNNLNVLRNTTLTDARALRVLYLRNTFLNEIEEGAFSNNNKLAYLDLSNNIFPVMNPFTKDIFKGLDCLIALDLSECHISHLYNDDVFFHIKNLKYLSLRMNSIYQISPNLFKNIPKLQVIDLRYNILVSWTSRIFSNNKHINQTLLDYNHLGTITDAMLDDFMSSQEVKLYGNNIICDCRLINTVNKVIPNVDVKDLSFSDEMNLCSNEDGETLGTFLGSVYSAKCIDTKWVTIVPTTLASLLFTALTVYIFYYYYKYDIHFWWLKTKRKLGLLHYIRGSKNMESTQGFKYDAFVSYCVEDEKFVEKMVYILETNCSQFKLCVFERDFKVGDVLTDRILECMECSRRTILLITEAFAKSQWCCWEMYMAQNRSISLNRSEPNDPLILIKKSDIPESLMTPTLRYLMKTRVYLEWHDSPIRQKIFWEQLINTLRP